MTFTIKMKYYNNDDDDDESLLGFRNWEREQSLYTHINIICEIWIQLNIYIDD